MSTTTAPAIILEISMVYKSNSVDGCKIFMVCVATPAMSTIGIKPS